MADRPNILFICTDQQYAGAMSCAGNRDLSTPGMDSLAESGILFTRTYCTHPLCAPARSSFVSGMMPHQTGVTGNGNPIHPELVPRALGNVLRDAGYRVGLAGKWHVPGTTPEACGFDVLCGTQDHVVPDASTAFMSDGDEPFFLFSSFINPHDVCQLARNQVFPQGNVEAPPHLDDCPNLPPNLDEPPYGPEMLRFVQRHNPRVYPTVDYTPDDWRRFRHTYYRLVEKVDREVERVLDGLRASGKLDNTLVIFTSDHGDGHGAHGWNQKTCLYEEVINVPMIASWQGVTARGLSDVLVSNGLDLFPTACEAAGVGAPDDLPGLSLMPIVRGASGVDWRDDLVVETQTGIGDGPGGPTYARAVVGERYKYSVYAMGRYREQLVDLDADRGEMVNLAVESRFGGLLQEHRDRLRGWCGETGDDVGRLIP